MGSGQVPEVVRAVVLVVLVLVVGSVEVDVESVTAVVVDSDKVVELVVESVTVVVSAVTVAKDSKITNNLRLLCGIENIFVIKNLSLGWMNMMLHWEEHKVNFQDRKSYSQGIPEMYIFKRSLIHYKKCT